MQSTLSTSGWQSTNVCQPDVERVDCTHAIEISRDVAGSLANASHRSGVLSASGSRRIGAKDRFTPLQPNEFENDTPHHVEDTDEVVRAVATASSGKKVERTPIDQV